MHTLTHISSREGTFYRLHFGNALVSFSLMIDLLISFKWYYSYKSAFILLPLNFSEVLYGLNEFQKIFLDYQPFPPAKQVHTANFWTSNVIANYFPCHSFQRGSSFTTSLLVPASLVSFLLMSGESVSSVHGTLLRFRPLYPTTYQTSTSGHVSLKWHQQNKKFISPPHPPPNLLPLHFSFS